MILAVQSVCILIRIIHTRNVGSPIRFASPVFHRSDRGSVDRQGEHLALPPGPWVILGSLLCGLAGVT